MAAWSHVVGALPSRGYGIVMVRALVLIMLLVMAGCEKPAPEGPTAAQTAVADKAEADVVAAEAAAGPASIR